jgi:hypothetical protein
VYGEFVDRSEHHASSSMSRRSKAPW